MTSVSAEQTPAPFEREGSEYEILLVLDESVEYRYAALCPSLPGCLSEGRTRDEAVAMIKDAAALYLADFTPGEQPSHPTAPLAILADEYVTAGFPVETTTITI